MWQLVLLNSLCVFLLAGQIHLTMFDVEDHTNISTYYFRLRSADTRGNIANWSNPVSASYINPDLYTTPVCLGLL